MAITSHAESAERPRLPSTNPIDRGVADVRLARLNDAAAGLLEPLLAGDVDAQTAAALARAIRQWANVANSLGLRGPEYLATLLLPFLQSESGRDFVVRERAPVERWVGDVIAYCAGQLDASGIAGLVAQLDEWRGFSGVPGPFVALIGERLRSDARQLSDWLRMARSVGGDVPLRGMSGVSTTSGADPDQAAIDPSRTEAAAHAETAPDRSAFESDRRADSPQEDIGLLGDDELPTLSEQVTLPARSDDLVDSADPAFAGEAIPAFDPSAGASAVWPDAQARWPWGRPTEIANDELIMLADAAGELADELVPALLGLPLADQGGLLERIEFVGEYRARIENLHNAAQYMGVAVLTRLFSGLLAQFEAWHSQPDRFDEEGRRLLLLLPDTLASLFGAFERPYAASLAELLGDAGWPVPLAHELQEPFESAIVALRRVESRQVALHSGEITDDELSLRIPSEADRSVVDNLLRELPALSAEFGESVSALLRGDATQLDRAQRVAHTLKGSAHTVGVNGIANLTHRLEDILQLLAREQQLPSPKLGAQLADAADCLADMCDAVAGIGAEPERAPQIYRALIASANALVSGEVDAEGEGKGESDAAANLDDGRAAASASSTEATTPEAPSDRPGQGVAQAVEGALDDGHAETPAAAAGVAAASGADPGTASGGPAPAARAGAEDELLRVPAGVVSRLLDFANEAVIALSQMQERIDQLEEARASLRAGSERFQDLSMELERLVDVRGIALTGRSQQADFDALELDEYNDLHTVSRRFAEAGADHKLVDQQFDRELQLLRDQTAQLDRVQTDLREAALQTRMVAFDTIGGRLQRAVRQAARLSGKEVELHLHGGDTAVDSYLMQSIIDPLMHVLRNAVDHGIEPLAERTAMGKAPVGRIDIDCQREGAELRIRCRDDGRGLDLPAIVARAREQGLIDPAQPVSAAEAQQLILLPGFSTRTQATQLSGRGIGLDVVRERLRALRGRIDIASAPDRGTAITLSMPLRLASVPVMVVRAPQHVLALAVREVASIESITELAPGAVVPPRMRIGSAEYPARSLESLLGLPDGILDGEGVQRVALITRAGPDGLVAVIAPEPGQTRSVILQPLAARLPEIAGIAGVAVLGDGAVAPILDLPELLSRRDALARQPARRVRSSAALPVCLIVDDSVSVRRTMELFLQDIGLQVDTASDGIEALAAIDRRRPDLVIADLEMPRMNGAELASALRGRTDTADVPFIMISSRYSEKHKQFALAAGVDIFLTKPYTEDELAAQVQRCLHLRG